MPTNEERREIARKFREELLGKWGDFNGTSLAAAIGAFDDEEMFDDMGDVNFELLVERLSELIDPEPERTCQLRYDEVHRDYVCSSCGVWLSLDSYQRETENGAVYRRFRYCPECGARVKDDK